MWSIKPWIRLVSVPSSSFIYTSDRSGDTPSLLPTPEMSSELSKHDPNTSPSQIDEMAKTNGVPSDRVGEVLVQHAAMHQEFNLWSTLGIGFSYIATPLSIGSFLVYSLAAGGSAYFFWGYVVCFIFQTLVVISMAEIAGFAPHTSGKDSR